MKLNNIFPNYETFKNDVIDKLNLLFPNVEWLNEQNSYMSFQTLYGLLSLYYGDRDIRYDNAQTFINKFTFNLADVLPDIYAKQQVFINNELNRYLSSAQNRAIKISGTTNSNRNQNNNSKAANSTTPTNIVITSTAELNNLPITSANLSNIELIDNINSNNEQTNFKYIDDLIKNLTSDYSLRLKEFMNLIKNHFTFIDTSNVQKECDGLYEGTRFRNGPYVSDVDYLGVENKEQIKLTNGKVQTNTINIEKLQSSIGSLPDFNNIINTINKNTSDIKVINNEQRVQNNNIQINTNDISRINQSLSTYATIVFVNNKLEKYLDKEIYNNDKQIIENDIITLKAKDIQLENTINTNTTNIQTNTSDISAIKTQQTQQDNLINQKVNTSDFNNYQQSNNDKINELSAQQQTNTNAINSIKWVPLTNIIRDNHRTTINLEGKRFIHLQGRFTSYTTDTGSWNNFTPFTIDTHNYNYMVRFPIFDWNTQRLNGSIEVILENGNLILIGYNTNNQQTNYYLWGDVIGSN